MENNEFEESIDSKFKIIEKIGHGGTANVFLVKEINTSNIYAAKVLLENDSVFYEKEINILNSLKESNNPYIANIIASGEGSIIRKNRPKNIKKYFVLEYLPKGELIDYISFPKSGLGELYSKYIFAKILNGIQSCHDKGICHRDLKLENILITNEYSPKLCDFGFATKNAPNLSEYIGTQDHAAPEVLMHKPYDGFKADIFSLGVVLINLTTSKQCFRSASKNDSNYKFIILNKLDRFWSRVDKQINQVSKELKNLFIKMVSFKPDDRPNIQEILNSEWMKEINVMTQEQKDKIDNDIKEEFQKRESIVNELKTQNMEFVNLESEELSNNNRSGGDLNKYFEPYINPKELTPGKQMDNYIQLKGISNPNIFMNILCKNINKEFEGICNIETENKYLAFNIYFDEVIEEEEEDEELVDEMKEEIEKLGINNDEEIEEDENMKGSDICIRLKLYENKKGDWRYILRFIKKKGNRADYLEKLEKIFNLVKKLNN